jgi:acyl-CoA thioester hydrolase
MPALISYRTPIQAAWVDYNDHLRDAYYLLIFSYATDALMDCIGLDSDSREQSGHSLYTLECHLNFLHEVKRGTQVWVQTHIVGFDHKRLHLYHSLHREGADQALAASEQMLLHVDLAGPRSAPFAAHSVQSLSELVARQKDLPPAAFLGRVIKPLG